LHDVLHWPVGRAWAAKVIRFDNGPQFAAKAYSAMAWKRRREDDVHRVGRTWENGYCESFNSKQMDELLNGEKFTTLYETMG
jgi:putative transposase